MNDGISIAGTRVTALGRYKLLRLLGRGGMGEVWLGADPNLHRQVAIKTLPAHNKDDREYLQRFVREAQAAAGLNHPHIVPVHDYGEQSLPDGSVITYLVMPYITGGSLEERIRASQQQGGAHVMTQRAALEYLWQAAQAIDYAHERGIIHRDIKPANMLLRSDDWLMLADFGIARVLQSPEHLTETGAGFGTPHYMAPEQARGKAEIRSDNYSLAVIAYRLFTGRFPFDADTGYAITIQHLTLPVPVPHQFNSALSVVTDDVLVRGLAKEPAERYPSAQAFIRDLQHSLGGSGNLLPVAPTQPQGQVVAGGAQPTTTSNQRIAQTDVQAVHDQQQQIAAPVQDVQVQAAKKGLTRRQMLTMGAGGVVALAAIGGVGVWAATPHQQLSGSTTTTTTTTTTPIVPRSPDDPIHVLRGHSKPVASMSWSNNNILATAGSATDEQVFLWDVSASNDSDARLSRQDVHGYNLFLAWSPDNKYITVGNYNDSLDENNIPAYSLTVYNSNIASRQSITLAQGFYQNPVTIKDSKAFTGLAWTPNGGENGTIIVARDDIPNSGQDEVAFISLFSGKNAHQQLLTVQENFLLAGSLLSDALSTIDVVATGALTKIACGALDGIYILELTFNGSIPSLKTTQHFLFDPKNPSDTTSAAQVAWSSNGQWLAGLPDKSTSIATWDTGKKNQRKDFNLPTTVNAVLSTVTWEGTPDGKRLAAGANDGHVYIWDYAGDADKPVRILNPGPITGTIYTMAWSKDGKWLAAAYNDNSSTVLVWKV
jgi:WD40 repeat protein